MKKVEKHMNREMHVVMYLFVTLFLCMMGYFVYYVQFKSTDEINNSYNTRQENLAAKVIRGPILSNDRQVLAQTLVDSDGNETRYYPFDDTFAHIVGSVCRARPNRAGTARSASCRPVAGARARIFRTCRSSCRR